MLFNGKIFHEDYWMYDQSSDSQIVGWRDGDKSGWMIVRPDGDLWCTECDREKEMGRRTQVEKDRIREKRQENTHGMVMLYLEAPWFIKPLFWLLGLYMGWVIFVTGYMLCLLGVWVWSLI